LPSLLIDDFADETLWQALTPADAPSAAITLASDAGAPAIPSGGACLRVALAETAGGDRIERGFGPLDLDDFAELRFWVRAAAPATGAPDAPFRLSMRLGSAALAIGAAGNDWVRHLPAEPGRRWSLVRVALDDLAPAVRTAADRIALRAATVSASATVWLDDLRAAAPRMTTDVDAALLAALDGGLAIGGQPVAAVIDAPGATAPSAPWIRLVQYDAAYAERRGGQARRRADYTDAGHRIWPEPEPWDLHYRIDFVSTDRAEQAAMLDFTIATLGGRGILDVGGTGLRIERVPNVLPDDALSPAPLLRYRVAAWVERGAPLAVAPVAAVRLVTGLKA